MDILLENLHYVCNIDTGMNILEVSQGSCYRNEPSIQILETVYNL